MAVINMTDMEFLLYKGLIKEKTGIDMGDDKKSLVYARLKNHLEKKGFYSFREYFEYIKRTENADEMTFFINKMTTNHTFFNREAAHYMFLRDTILPELRKKYGSTKDLRLWCAASSSGEEPYNIAFYINDYFDLVPGWNTEILATDISTAMLKKAIMGVYSKKSCEALTEFHIKKYLKEYDEDNYVVRDDLKKKVIFRHLNLVNDIYPFKQKLQVIFCRNVMIYFDTETREKVLQKMYDALEEGGYLFVSHSESLAHSNVKFEYVMSSVYRKPIKKK
ncbi:MAG: CheR family methyltransferase [Lachnospirales bacterium]